MRKLSKCGISELVTYIVGMWKGSKNYQRSTGDKLTVKSGLILLTLTVKIPIVLSGSKISLQLI